VSTWIVLAGACAGLGCFLVIREILPAAPQLDAALARLTSGATPESSARPSRRLARRVAASAPWLPVPSADLRLLGQDTEAWVASKVTCGLLGLAMPAILSALLTLGGIRPGWTFPVAVSLAIGVAFFMAPDLVTRVNAAERRADFRHALTSYLDLVALERSAGAGPSEALESAAGISGGWAFERIGAALDQARKAGAEPWAGLAQLARETGISELADLADIAGIAGQEGAKVLDTLLARAAAMRAEALAADHAKAASRTTTMVVPVALLATGYVLLLIFPDFYRVFIT
jgi:Flp pilus assembly protein TadB